MKFPILLTKYMVMAMFISLPAKTYAQNNGYVLAIVDSEAIIMLDGEEIGRVKPKKPAKFNVESGEHYFQAVSISNSEIEHGEIVTIESGKQKVLKIGLTSIKPSNAELENIDDATLHNLVSVADLDFTVPGLLVSQSEEYPGHPAYLYAFEKGDKIVLNFEMKNKNGTNVINVSTYPNESVKYTNDSFQELKNVVINVDERSIYVFTISTFHTFDRDCKLSIGRIPFSPDTKEFNTTVSWQEQYSVEVIHQPQNFYVNSGSNATLEDGKSRVLLPLNLPENTVKWYYEFSASRDETNVQQNVASFSLISDLTKLISNIALGGVLNFGIDQLTQPPGSDFCDIYLLDYENSSLFTSKQGYSYFLEATRENFKSGIVEAECCSGLTYLGIKNPSNLYGVHVVIEAAAIVKNSGWIMHAE